MPVLSPLDFLTPTIFSSNMLEPRPNFPRPDPQSIGSGCVVLIPIWRLRSIQGKVHPNMIFTSGRHKDISMVFTGYVLVVKNSAPVDSESCTVTLGIILNTYFPFISNPLK